MVKKLNGKVQQSCEMTDTGEVVYRGKRCMKMPILVKTKGQGTDTSQRVLTTLLLALPELSVYSIGKRTPDREDPGDFGASDILPCLWTEYYLSSPLTLWRSSQCCAWCPLQLTIFTVEAFSLTPLLLVWVFFFLVCFFVIPWLPWLFSQFHDGSDSV